MNDRETGLARTTGGAAPAPIQPTSAGKTDKALVDRAIKHIRDVVAKTVTRGLEDVGQYLLREFYDDDPELYFSSSPNKHASLRLLIERCESMEFPVSRTFLANALRIAAVTMQLPSGSPFRRLPPSHRVELLRVGEPARLERLATKAVEGKFTVKKLRAMVQKEGEREGASRRGRKRTPNVLGAVTACLRSLRDEETGRLLFYRSDIDALNDEQRTKTDAALVTLERRVAELRKLLG